MNLEQYKAMLMISLLNYIFRRLQCWWRGKHVWQHGDQTILRYGFVDFRECVHCANCGKLHPDEKLKKRPETYDIDMSILFDGRDE